MSTHRPREREKLFAWAVRLEWFTVLWNVVEAAVAIGAGLLAGSTALVGFGADSAIEVSSAVVLLWRLRRAGPAAGREEHELAEGRALYLVAGTFAALALWVGIDSGQALFARQPPDSSPVGIALAALSLTIMPLLAYGKERLGRLLGSEALRADAKETWVCSYLSLVLLLGLGLHAAAGWWWADSVGALAMLPVVLWQAWETFQEARGGEGCAEDPGAE